MIERLQAELLRPPIGRTLDILWRRGAMANRHGYGPKMTALLELLAASGAAPPAHTPIHDLAAHLKRVTGVDYVVGEPLEGWAARVLAVLWPSTVKLTNGSDDANEGGPKV